MYTYEKTLKVNLTNCN